MNPVSTASTRRTPLNPNAREFVPTSFRSSSSTAITVAGDETEPSTTSDNGKTFSDKTGSSDTCASDEESRRYWSTQLPDDLTLDTDFFIPAAAEEDIDEPGVSALRASASESCGLKETIDLVGDTSPWGKTVLNGKQPQGAAHVAAYDFSNAKRNVPIAPRQLWDDDRTSPSFSGNWSGQRSIGGNASIYSSALSQSALKENAIDALSLLANEFPNIPVQSLADVYQANGGDLSSTVRVLTQLKLQDEGSQWHSLPSPSRVSPNSRSLDFSAPSTPELASGLPHFPEDVDIQQNADFHRLSRKISSQWPYDRNGAPAEFSFGHSSFSPMNSYSSLFDGDTPSINDERFELSHVHHKHRLSPRSWMETDDALVNLMSELREEARNHGRIRNVYFEQARRQAFFVGNRGLAKEASAKGQFHNRLMKAAQNKAAEIDLQRNMSNVQSQSFGPGQTQLLDLRGLHVNEAVNLLKRELSALRFAARSSRQRQQVFISVGTGHAKGSRTPARLLFAVKRYLAEEELLNFTEPQPGIVKVVVS